MKVMMVVDIVVVMIEPEIVVEIRFRTAFFMASGSLPTEPLKLDGSAE